MDSVTYPHSQDYYPSNGSDLVPPEPGKYNARLPLIGSILRTVKRLRILDGDILILFPVLRIWDGAKVSILVSGSKKLERYGKTYGE